MIPSALMTAAKTEQGAGNSRALRDHYLKRLERDLDHCANIIGPATRPDTDDEVNQAPIREARETFAWRARRALESALQARILHAGVEVRRAKPKDDSAEPSHAAGRPTAYDFYNTIKHFNLCPNKSTLDAIEALRIEVNRAVHVEDSNTSLEDETILSVASKLSIIVRWIFRDLEINLDSYPMLNQALSDITSRPPKDRPPRDREIETLRDELARATKQLEDERQAHQGELARQKQEFKGLAFLAVIAAFVIVPIFLPDAPPKSDAHPAVAESANSMDAGIAATDAGGIPQRAEATNDSGGRATLLADGTSSDAAIPIVAADPDAATTNPALETLSCDAGMVRVDARRFRLAQPSGGRGNWPRVTPGAETPEVSVSAFCIDRQAVTASEVARWRSRTEGTARVHGCVPQPGASGPEVCVSPDEATAFCSERGGALPSIAEWEAVARTTGLGLRVDVVEWVEDLFPPAIFGRRSACTDHDPSGACARHMTRRELLPVRADPVARYSWNDAPRPQTGGRERDFNPGDVGFRCVQRFETAR